MVSFAGLNSVHQGRSSFVHWGSFPFAAVRFKDGWRQVHALEECSVAFGTVRDGRPKMLDRPLDPSCYTALSLDAVSVIVDI